MRCINGHVEMHVECEPKLDYGRRQVTWAYGDEGYGIGIARAPRTSAVELRLTTDLRLGFERGRARARTTLREGERRSSRSAGPSTRRPPTTTRRTAA